MDLIKLIESFEELLYRLALWFILLPRLINRYVFGEFEKSTEARFKDMLSPMLFWGLVGVAPHLMMIDLLATMKGTRVSTEPEWIAFMRAPWATRFASISAVALAAPLTIAARTLRASGKPIDRETLRLPFSVQCYCLTPVYVLLLPVVFFTLRYEGDTASRSSNVAGVASVAAVLWFLHAESAVLSEQLSIARLNGLIKSVAYMLVILGAFILLEFLVITISGGLSVWSD
jgi:hypothetical protein